MNNEKIIKDIEEIIMTNRIAKQLATTEMEKDSFRKSNDVLARAKTVIKNSEKDNYEKGLNDAWNLAFKISGSPDKGCYNNDELYEIFDCRSSCGVFDSYSYITALRLVEEYEKKKAEEEEAAKLVPGDVVVVKGMTYGDMKGIFIKYEDGDTIILTRKGGSVRLVGKDVWNIEKTGENVDISGLIGVLYE